MRLLIYSEGHPYPLLEIVSRCNYATYSFDMPRLNRKWCK